MTIYEIDTSKPHELDAAVSAAMRSDVEKIIFTGPAPEHERRLREAGIAVEVRADIAAG